MVVDKNQFRIHLKWNEDGRRWKCEFCGHQFGPGVQTKTFISHLAGVGWSRTRICENVPDDVRSEAVQTLQEIGERPRKRSRPMQCSSYEVQKEDVEAEGSRVEGNWEPTEPDAHETEEVQGGSSLKENQLYRPVQDSLHDFPADMKRSLMDEVGHELGDEEMTDADIGRVKDNREGALRQPRTNMLTANETEEVALLTTSLVGEAFERNIKDIWSCLLEDEALCIGVYGMGGVGKTTLITHVHNKLLEEWCSSGRHVYWITVSRDFSISKLQNQIAKTVHLDLSNEEDERKRASKLYKTLTEKRRCVFILDDLWNYFDIDKVGIPVKLGQCKLLLTTRSRKICHEMRCSMNNIFQVQLLSNEEAWELFTKELGCSCTEVEELAKAVARECSGLPLGIRTMARSMRGITDVCEWRNALRGLRESKGKIGGMREEVFGILKFSYLHLNDSALQECFLYCALFPEDDMMEREMLIGYLIAEGIIDEENSRQEEFDRGQAMLSSLENACL